MQKITNNIRIVIVAVILILAGISITLHIHNALLYEPSHGFDGSGHVYYAQYIAQNWSLPNPNQWETHQPPLYYIIGALFILVTRMNIKALQFVNPIIFFIFLLVAYIGLKKVFTHKWQILLGTFSLLALPMLNIFPPMATNELLNATFICAVIVASIFIAYAKTKRELLRAMLFTNIFLALGFYTKVSIFTAIPAYVTALIIQAANGKKLYPTKKFIAITLLGIILLIAIIVPIFIRTPEHSPNNPLNVASTPIRRNLYFFTRIDWIWKVDMFTTQYYSFLGGSWNSFWQDGHNAITPFVSFHKKVLVLWSLGFVLLPLSIYGLIHFWHKHNRAAMVVFAYAVTALGIYLLFNLRGNHYSAVRLTYIMPIALVYAFGIAGAASNTKLRWILLALLLIQYSVMVSHFWIQPWWHVTS
ncbi:MAG: glycosyltransferase family 39 protein [Candidatus Roizmanbacteria bacterium]|nr:glycosyltransferase family 39 protein [Candidatus Roizmanbacteria bacterium]